MSKSIFLLRTEIHFYYYQGDKLIGEVDAVNLYSNGVQIKTWTDNDFNNASEIIHPLHLV